MGRTPGDVAFELGVRLRVARHRMGQTQAEVARAAGISSSALSRIELGRGDGVPLGIWAALAEVVADDIFAPPEDRTGVYREAFALLAADGGWSLAGRRPGVAWFDRPARPIRIMRTVLRPAERVVVRVVPTLTDLEIEHEWLRRMLHEVRSDTPPGRLVERLLVVVRTEGAVRRAGPAWRHSTGGWIRAVRSPDARMPTWPGLTWMTPAGTHLLPAA